MYEWVNGRPALLVRLRDLDLWPGESGTLPGSSSDGFVRIEEFEGAKILSVNADAALTTSVALELGGLLLVSATYCDDDASVAEHLDLVPVSGWKTLPTPFVSVGDEYVLVDGAQRGHDLADPEKSEELVATSGAVVPVNLPEGNYEVEVFGPWRPDDRTELYLTRLVRESQSGVTPLEEFEEI